MNRFYSRGETLVLPPMPMAALRMGRNDAFHHDGAGGGGYGRAFERDPPLVLEDVLDEKVSVAGARRDYGVAIDEVALAIDHAETERLRAGERAVTRCSIS
jgi:N-methylhydantoinase B